MCGLLLLKSSIISKQNELSIELCALMIECYRIGKSKCEIAKVLKLDTTTLV